VALDPVRGAALAVLLHVVALRAGFAIQLDTAPEHGPDAFLHRAVRVFGGLAFRVVLAMDRDPFARHHRRRQPGPEAEHVGDDRMEVHAAVRHAAVQVQGHRENGELGGDQQVHGKSHPAGLKQAVREEAEESNGHCRLRWERSDGKGRAGQLPPTRK
jgi:hypothetical protein